MTERGVHKIGEEMKNQHKEREMRVREGHGKGGESQTGIGWRVESETATNEGERRMGEGHRVGERIVRDRHEEVVEDRERVTWGGRDESERVTNEGERRMTEEEEVERKV